LKTIVIGTGIAGYGAYLAFKDKNKLYSVKFYSYGDFLKTTPNSRKKFTFFSMPKKTEFGISYLKEKVDKSPFSVGYTNTNGGLSDFWSGSFFPFTKKELKSRKIQFLEKYYKLLSGKLNIFGRENEFNKLIPHYYTDDNFIASSNLDFINNLSDKKCQNFKIFSGNNRVLTTKNRCIYCGECFLGCTNNVIFRPMKNFKGANIVNVEIEYVKRVGEKWFLYNNNEVIDSCDNLILGLGVVNTIKLLIKSNLLDPKKVEIYDSNAITFLMKLKKRKNAMNYKNSYGYANKIIFTENNIGSDSRFNVQLSILPFNHFFTYSIFTSKIGKFLNNYFYNNFALGMFFSSKKEANTYQIDSNLKLSIKQNKGKEAKKTLQIISKKINNFLTHEKIINFFMQADSSIHYSSNLIKRKNNFYESVHFKKNLFIIDGNIFPGKPSPNGNSFSIMAGSYAITQQLLDKN
jgi:hypothetical protein